MYKSILVIPDLHCPVMHQDAFKFIKWLRDEYGPDKVVCLGDELDYHCLSFHDNSIDNPYTESSEFEEGKRYWSNMYDMFDEVDILTSNHGSMVYRKAASCRIPRNHLRTYEDVLEAPSGYKWYDNLILQSSDGQYINFHHGNMAPADILTKSQRSSINQVQGHHHNKFEIRYWGNVRSTFYGMTCGCLIDDDKFAFDYNKNNIPRPILGAGIIYEGVPNLIPMQLDENKRWVGA